MAPQRNHGDQAHEAASGESRSWDRSRHSTGVTIDEASSCACLLSIVSAELDEWVSNQLQIPRSVRVCNSYAHVGHAGASDLGHVYLIPTVCCATPSGVSDLLSFLFVCVFFFFVINFSILEMFVAVDLT